MKKSFALLLAVAVMLSAAMFSACDSSTRYINVTSEISGETYRINRMEQKKAYVSGGMGIHFYTKLSPVEVARKLEGQAEKVEAYGNKLLLTYDLGGGKKDFLVVNSIVKTTDSENEYFVRSAVASKSSQKTIIPAVYIICSLCTFWRTRPSSVTPMRTPLTLSPQRQRT